jgi:signal transduction histidine kinase
MKYILIITLLNILLNAQNVLLIDENFSEQTSAGYTEYTKDINRSFAPHRILNSKDLIETKNVTYLKIDRGLYWSRTRLKNVSHEAKNLVLYNILPEIDYINIYIFRENRPVEELKMGELGKDRKTRQTEIELYLKPNEEVTVISSYENFFLYDVGWVVMSSKDFIAKETLKLVAFGFFIGAGVVLSIISFLMFLIFKDTTYLFIIAYSLINLVHHFGFHGFSYLLEGFVEAKTISILTWLVPVVVVAFDLFYVYVLFNLKGRYDFLVKFIFFFGSFAIATTIHTAIIYYHGSDEVIVFSANFLTLSSSFAMLSIGLLALYLYYKEGGIAKIYFVIAQLIIAIGFAIFTFSFHHIGEFREEMEYLFPVLSQLYIVFILLAQYKRTQNSIDELNKKKEFLLQQSRFSAIGQAIGHVSHQWKAPMSSIGGSITLLETIYIHQKDKFENHFEKQLPKIKQGLSFMKETMNEFNSYFSSNINETSMIDLNKTLQNTLNILGSKIIIKNVKLEEKTENIEVSKNFENIFSNIFMVLINNSLDEFDKSSENKIKIKLFQTKKEIVLDYSDNGGGIKVNPIDSIFEYFISTKEDGQGLGLPITKMLIEDRLKGNIKVKNINGGANFLIKVPI